MFYKVSFHKQARSSISVGMACLLTMCLVSGCSDAPSPPSQRSNITPSTTSQPSSISPSTPPSTSTPPSGEATSAAESDAPMDAGVTFVTANDNIAHPGEQFIVQNNNDNDWHEVTLTITARRGKGTVASEDFIKKTVTIPAHKAYYVLMSGFVGEDTNRRFDPQWFLDPDLRSQYFVSGKPGGVQFEIDASGPNDAQEHWETAESQGSDIPEHIGQ